MVLIFNVAPILGVRCKQNVDERNPSLSLPSCLCRVCVLPIICPHESSQVRAQHLFGSLKSAALQPCDSLARTIKLMGFSLMGHLGLGSMLPLKWPMLQKNKHSRQ